MFATCGVGIGLLMGDIRTCQLANYIRAKMFRLKTMLRTGTDRECTVLPLLQKVTKTMFLAQLSSNFVGCPSCYKTNSKELNYVGGYVVRVFYNTENSPDLARLRIKIEQFSAFCCRNVFHGGNEMM